MRPHDRARRKVVTLPETFAPAFWNEADGRSVVVREIRDRVARLASDCGADSTQKKMLVQRAVFIGLQIESMEVAATETRQIEMGVYVQACNALMGLLKALGLEKAVKHAGGLKAYLADDGKDDE